MNESPIQMTEEQKKEREEYMKKKIDEFLPKYQKVVDETGMQLAAVLQNNHNGITPHLIVVEKQSEKASDGALNKA